MGYENLKPNIGGHVSFDALHYDTKMLANLEAAGLAHRTDKTVSSLGPLTTLPTKL